LAVTGHSQKSGFISSFPSLFLSAFQLPFLLAFTTVTYDLSNTCQQKVENSSFNSRWHWKFSKQCRHNKHLTLHRHCV